MLRLLLELLQEATQSCHVLQQRPEELPVEQSLIWIKTKNNTDSKQRKLWMLALWMLGQITTFELGPQLQNFQPSMALHRMLCRRSPS
jgi:hypothetical protein